MQLLLPQERDNVKLEYQKLFNSIKKTRSQTQTEIDELIAHVSEKTYAYGVIRAENQNLLLTIYELKTRLANVEKVHKTRFSKESTLSESLDTTYVVSKPKIDVESTSKANDKVVQIILWIVDSGRSKHMTGDRSLLKIFIDKFMGTVRFGNDNFAAITGYGDDLLTGSRESNLYTISIFDMAASSPGCLMSKALDKSWFMASQTSTS
ncbi:hypothetical protein Tco_0788244 [Tanacetum coccineum]